MELKRIIVIAIIVVFGLVLLDGAIQLAGFVSVVSTGLTIHTSADDRIVDVPGDVRFEYTALSPLFCSTSCHATLIRHDTSEIIARSELGALSTGSISARIEAESSLKRVPVQLVLTCSTAQTRYCSMDEQLSVDVAIVRFDLDNDQHAIRSAILEAREELEQAFSTNTVMLEALRELETPYDDIASLARSEREPYASAIEAFLTAIRREDYRHPPEEPDSISAWRAEEDAYPRALELSERIAERLTILTPYRTRYGNDRPGFENLTSTYRELNETATRSLEELERISEELDHIESTHGSSIITGSLNSARSTHHQLEAACAIRLAPCPEPIKEPTTIEEAYALNSAMCTLVETYQDDPYAYLLSENVTYEDAYEAYNISGLRANASLRELERAVLTNLSLASNLTLAERLAIRIPIGASYCDEEVTPITIGFPTITVEPEPIEVRILGERTCTLGSCEHDASAPILFIHGHSFAQSTDPRYNLQGMTRLAHSFEPYGYLYAGHLFPTTTRGIGTIDAPVSFTATYYVNSYEEEGEIRISTFKSEPIETYALRLREDIEEAKRLTGSDTVVLVAHSMGGLVARSYLDLFGTTSVERLIMIGTPNHGIVDRTERLCPLLGASLECRDMTSGSVFLRRLNQNPLPDIPIRIIAGDGCDGGDGVVELENALLTGVNTTIINGTCTGIETLHSHLIDPRVIPETLEIIAADLGR